MRIAHKNGKFKAALGLLNEAALEKKGLVFEALEDRYSTLKERLADQADQGKAAVGRAKNQMLKVLREEEKAILEKAKAIDKKIRTNPWPFVGVAAAGAFILGMRAARKRNKKSAAKELAQQKHTEQESEETAAVRE